MHSTDSWENVSEVVRTIPEQDKVPSHQLIHGTDGRKGGLGLEHLPVKGIKVPNVRFQLNWVTVTVSFGDTVAWSRLTGHTSHKQRVSANLQRVGSNHPSQCVCDLGFQLQVSVAKINQATQLERRSLGP